MTTNKTFHWLLWAASAGAVMAGTALKLVESPLSVPLLWGGVGLSLLLMLLLVGDISKRNIASKGIWYGAVLLMPGVGVLAYLLVHGRLK